MSWVQLKPWQLGSSEATFRVLYSLGPYRTGGACKLEHIQRKAIKTAKGLTREMKDNEGIGFVQSGEEKEPTTFVTYITGSYTKVAGRFFSGKHRKGNTNFINRQQATITRCCKENPK